MNDEPMPAKVRLSEGLGPLPEAARTLAVRDGNRHWFHTSEMGAHGEGVYSAGEVVAYTLGEVQRAVAAERKRILELQAMLQEVGKWGFRGRSVAETYDISKGAGSWRRAVRA